MLETSLRMFEENYRKGLKLNPTRHSSVLGVLFFLHHFPLLYKNKQAPPIQAVSYINKKVASSVHLCNTCHVTSPSGRDAALRRRSYPPRLLLERELSLGPFSGDL